MKMLTMAMALGAMALATPAGAATFVFHTALDGAAENPPNASPATGFSTLTIDDVLHTMRVEVDFEGLTGTTLASHVHAPTAEPRTGNAGIATELPSFTGFPLGVTAGAYDHTFDTSLTATWNPAFLSANGGTALGAEQAFITALRLQRGYINIHTTTFPPGEIRGFYAVPEPTTWVLMILGFGAAGAMLRARQRPAYA